MLMLPLEVARRDAIANLKSFGPRDTSDLILMVSFSFTMRRYLIRLDRYHSERLRSNGGWVNMKVLFSAVCELKFMKFRETWGDFLYFPMPFHNCRVLFQRYGPLKLPWSCEDVENVENKWVLAHFTGEYTPNFGHAFSNRIHFRTCGRCWLSSVRWICNVAEEERKRR